MPQKLTHPDVVHPRVLLAVYRALAEQKQNRFVTANDRFLEWVTGHLLASMVMFDLALILPLLVLAAPDWVKLTLMIVSSNWIQWWALPALQRSSNKIQHRQEVKADVDHRTLTYLARMQDEQIRILRRLDARKPGGAG